MARSLRAPGCSIFPKGTPAKRKAADNAGNDQNRDLRSQDRQEDGGGYGANLKVLVRRMHGRGRG